MLSFSFYSLCCVQTSAICFIQLICFLIGTYDIGQSILKHLFLPDSALLNHLHFFIMYVLSLLAILFSPCSHIELYFPCILLLNHAALNCILVCWIICSWTISFYCKFVKVSFDMAIVSTLLQ